MAVEFIIVKSLAYLKTNDGAVSTLRLVGGNGIDFQIMSWK